MNEYNSEPTRILDTCIDDNGRPSWKSFTSPKSVKVRGECQIPPHLPGIIIFVHGVNSTGEWYEIAEKNICMGLNARLGLNDTNFKLQENVYSCDNDSADKGFRRLEHEGRSPVIRFYWGYRAADGEEGKYKIPLVNIRNEDYHQLLAEGASEADVRKKGPFFWGGGPFQNGTTQLVSLWSKEGFKSKVLGVVPVQKFAPDLDRLLTDAPPREYYAHAAKRLADLVDLIREEYPHDTVSIISHSQGTMIAMAATTLAKKAPDALFILNSPYAMEAKTTDSLALPAEEVSSDNARSQTLSAIIDKIAEQAGMLKAEEYNALCVGKTDDKKRWTPNVTLPSSDSETRIPERDNHGRFYIYCNPHDRVMGASPLLSLGWQGLKNNPDGSPHPMLEKHKGHLYQRILARWLPCGDTPNPRTSFTPTDGKPFWDDDGDWLTYNNPGYWTLDINSEKVPAPISADKLTELDETRNNKDERPGEVYGYGWGQLNKEEHDKSDLNIPNDDTYKNYINLYPFEQILTGYEQSGFTRIPRYRRETVEERNVRVGKYISQPTDHSTLPRNEMFMSRVVAYDIPIGFCDASRNKAFMAKLRAMADWTQGYDSYMEKGILDIPKKPDIINGESTADATEINNRDMGRLTTKNKW
ncbi:alpha/beta hydrolase [Pantoea anthophila]|uniref:alpha/beta hydrolase n=1 Tax=Pantoea anthophila TaxID=470931 RepID=UPI00332D6B02